MEIKDKVKKIEQHYQVFVAYDGTEFTDMDECEVYEESAVCALHARIKDMGILRTEGGNVLPHSTEEVVEIVVPKSEDDIQTINHYIKAKRGALGNPLTKAAIGKHIALWSNIYDTENVWCGIVEDYMAQLQRVLDGDVEEYTD